MSCSARARAADDPMTAFTPTDAARAALGSVRTLVVPTDPGDEGYARARRAALELAAANGAAVVLHDRSDEHWTETPHAEGPFDLDTVAAGERDHLPGQMRPFADAGVEVSAWYATVPALTDILEPVQGLDADAVLVPLQPEKPRVMDRLQPGSDLGEQIGRVLDQNLERTVYVFVVRDDDAIEVLATVDRTGRPD